MLDRHTPLRPHPILPHYHADEAERRRQVQTWFDRSAAHYDWISQVLSFGFGNFYRRRALERAGLTSDLRALDVACGTGLLAAHAGTLVGERGLAVGLDPSRGMLARARARGVVRLAQGVAEQLPFPEASFELLSMGYALRHVADLHATFREYRRVLRPGGRLLILEISRPRARWSLGLLRLYLRRVVPRLARWRARDRAPQELMEYYWDTIESCVSPETILHALREAGFARVEHTVRMGILSEYLAAR